MKRIDILLLPVVVALAGCAGDIADGAETPAGDVAMTFTADETRLLEQHGQSLRLTEAQTAALIDEAVALMDVHSTATTRAAARGVRRSVASIRPLVTAPLVGAVEATRSDGASSEAFFSVVDFADSLGYCILAADRRIPDPIICFVPDGSFPHAEAAASNGDGSGVANPGLRLMLDAIGLYTLSTVSRHDAWCDSVATALLTRTGAASLDDLKRSLATATRADADGNAAGADAAVYEPLRATWLYNDSHAPMTPVEWGQQKPFNATVVANTEWSNTPVGCVALAATGIMAYWGYPTSYHGLNGGRIDWAELTRWSGSKWDRPARYRDWDGPMTEAPAETQKLVADLIWHVADDVNMDFGSSVSLAYTSDAPKLLAELGFTETHATSFSTDRAMGSLRAERPMIIQGASHKLSTKSTYANAHAWIVDGYIEQRWWDCFRIDHRLYEVEQYRTFLHNNFGWNGLDNGYYASGIFDTNAGPALASDTTRTVSGPGTRAEWIGEHYNYQFNIQIYPNIYK